MQSGRTELKSRRLRHLLLAFCLRRRNLDTKSSGILMVHSFIIHAIAVLTSSAAALLSALLYRARGGSKFLPGCGEDNSGCDSVLHTRWALWGPLPVAVLGAFINGTVCACFLLLLTWPAAPLPWRSLSWRFLIASIPMFGAAGLWFIALQAIVLRRFCLYCNMIHILGFITASLTAVLAISSTDGPNLAIQGLPPIGVVPVIAGIIGAIGLIGVQVLWQPKMFQITAVEASSFLTAPAQHHPGESSPSRLPTPMTQDEMTDSHRPTASRTVTLLGGKVSLSVDDWPVLGSPDAEKVLVYFFDYTCDSCRQLHLLFTQVIAQDSSLAILLIPIPGEPTCNPHISRRDPKHVNACALARLGLLVWLSDPSSFATYDEFVFAAEQPPLLSAAVAVAQELVTKEIFDPSIADSAVDPRLQSGIALFHSLGLSKTPALVLRTGILRGSVATVKDLREIVKQDLEACENHNA